jgi:ribosome-associated protein
LVAPAIEGTAFKAELTGATVGPLPTLFPPLPAQADSGTQPADGLPLPRRGANLVGSKAVDSLGRIESEFVASAPLDERMLVASSTIGESSSAARSGRALARANVAAQTASDNRGRDIAILDMRQLSAEFDYFVLATGSSNRQMHAMSEEIDHKLEDELGDRRLGIEGYQHGRWILLDYGDVVIHLFDQEARRYYDLDELWCRAKRVPFEPDSGQADDPVSSGSVTR